jgi:hypothetical protein
MEPEETDLIAAVIAEAWHNRMRDNAPQDAFGDEMRLAWVELDAPYKQATTDAVIDLIDRGLLVPGAAIEAEVERRREMAAGRA